MCVGTCANDTRCQHTLLLLPKNEPPGEGGPSIPRTLGGEGAAAIRKPGSGPGRPPCCEASPRPSRGPVDPKPEHCAGARRAQGLSPCTRERFFGNEGSLDRFDTEGKKESGIRQPHRRIKNGHNKNRIQPPNGKLLPQEDEGI